MTILLLPTPLIVAVTLLLILCISQSCQASATALLRSSSSTIPEEQHHRRRLSFESIARYEPRSLVTDHNAIDLDQQALEKQLSLGTDASYQTAKALYEQGAFSKSVATIRLTRALTTAIPAKAAVLGHSADDGDVAGSLLQDAAVGATTLSIQYRTNEIQSTYVGCQVGANPTPQVSGCLAAFGNVTVLEESGTSSVHAYSYTRLTENTNERTLQGFSLQAEEKMNACQNCPYRTFAKFRNYYGTSEYANDWIQAAFGQRKTEFLNGNADFSLYGKAGQTEAIKKGSVYMAIWMYVIREFEDALDDCQEACTLANCNDDPVHAWDEGVAFYTGSLEGTKGDGLGVLLHQLADKRCENFQTCGVNGDETSGLSQLNIHMFKEFSLGQGRLLKGECKDARKNKERIEELMAVPLIQGTLRYAYLTAQEGFSVGVDEKAESEGAVFAASILPLIHECDHEAAAIVYDNMKVGQNGRANFPKVKEAIESTYECLHLTCQDIGGLYDTSTNGYFDEAEPCVTSSVKRNKSQTTPIVIGATVGGVVGVLLLVLVVSKVCGSGGKDFEVADGIERPAGVSS